MQAPGGGAPGVRTQGGKGDDRSCTASPPPLQRDKCRTSCLRRACDVLTPEDGQRGRPPPPRPPSPPATQERGEDSEETARGHGGEQRTNRNAGGGVEWRWRTFMRRRRRPTLHHAVKDKRLTILDPVKQPEMDFMSHRGITHA